MIFSWSVGRFGTLFKLEFPVSVINFYKIFEFSFFFLSIIFKKKLFNELLNYTKGYKPGGIGIKWIWRSESEEVYL